VALLLTTSTIGVVRMCNAELKAEPKEIVHHLPRLSSVFPQGAQQGTRTKVEILGEYLDRAQYVVANDPAMHGRVLGGTYSKLDVELEVDAHAALGPHYFRIITPRGASNVLLFRVGDLRHQLEREPNSTFEQAEEVSPAVTINGRLDREGDFDFFKFRASGGDTWVFDLRECARRCTHPAGFTATRVGSLGRLLLLGSIFHSHLRRIRDLLRSCSACGIPRSKLRVPARHSHRPTSRNDFATMFAAGNDHRGYPLRDSDSGFQRQALVRRAGL
jgi:hypothetical protein